MCDLVHHVLMSSEIDELEFGDPHFALEHQHFIYLFIYWI